MDEAWARLEPLLPAQKPHTGRTAQAHRMVLEGILWALAIRLRPRFYVDAG